MCSWDSWGEVAVNLGVVVVNSGAFVFQYRCMCGQFG